LAQGECLGRTHTLIDFQKEVMGQSLACCSEQTLCKPETLQTPRSANGTKATSSTHPERGSIRRDSPPGEGVLLKELQKLFDMYAGKDGKLGVAEMAKIWEKCAHEKLGDDLKQEEKKLIKESARSYLQAVDIDRDGRVDRTEFYSFMLGGLDRRGPLCQMQEFLRKQLESRPDTLQKALAKFIEWDTDGDGFITEAELRAQMNKFLKANISKGPNAEVAPFDVDAMLEQVDIDADGRIDLWEFLAYSLGRRKVPVELLLYDITSGKSEVFSSLLTGKNFEAIYHSSILVHGKEFWYGGNIFMSKPPMSQHFGPTLEKSGKMKMQPSTYLPELMCVHLGYTLMTLDEIIEYQQAEGGMAAKFTRTDYDVLTRNCNHYSNELAQVLCGNGIPDAITSQPQLIMDAPRLRLLVPFLNKWLGGFGNGDDSHAAGPQKQELVDAAEKLQHDAVADTVGESSDGPRIVSFDPAVMNGGLPSCEEQFGHVVHTPHGSMQLRYFDPKTCSFAVQHDPSAHLQAIDPKRPVGFDSIQSIAALAEEKKKGFLSRFTERKKGRQPSQKAARRA